MMVTRADQELIEVMCHGLSDAERGRTIELMEEGNRRPEQRDEPRKLGSDRVEPDDATSSRAVVR